MTTLPTTPEGAGFETPAYDARALSDLLPAVARALGVRDPALVGEGPGVLDLPEADSYVVFLVDGLGHDLLVEREDVAPYLHSLLGRAPGTACVPSTTATSLTSLGTGLPPGSHGVVGFTSRIPATGKLLNALAWSKDVDPVDWQPHPTLFARLAGAGVTTTMVNKREFAGSGLTVASSRGAEFVGADRPGERLVAVQAASRTGPSLTYMYDGDLDWTGHRYGVASAQWEAQLSLIDLAAERLREELPDHTRILVVADHGMVDAAPDHRLDIDAHPELRDGVALLGGEARFRHVYCRSGAVDDVRATWTGLLGERAVVLTREEAFVAGWFGATEAQVRPRIGDVVAACTEDYALLSSVDFPYETTLVGMHGSLTPVEMRIPVLVG